jgi:2-methylisocitrate lyase-like PEP mutase family enzyme
MTTQTEKAEQFLALHRPGSPLLLPNPWDLGSAKILAAMGFQALATTSSGFAMTLGRLDGSVSRDEALAHAAAIVAATELPVSADLENCFADDPAGVAHTVTLAVQTGLAGCSVEDFTGDDDDPVYDIGLAAERVTAAAAAAQAGPARLILTARAENYLHGRPDLVDTITRLQAYQAAGADVLYAPGLTSLADIRQVVSAVDRPVNVLAMPGTPPVGELAKAGVSRVSVGGAFAFAAVGALADAAAELRDKGTYGYLAGSAAGRRAIQRAMLASRDAAPAVVAEQVAGLAVERLAEPCQGAEPDRPGMTVLQDGQVDHADADPFGELGQGHAPVGEELVEVDDDGVVVWGCGRHYTVPSRSARMAAPARMMRAKMTRPRPNQKTGHDTDQAAGHWPQSTCQVTSWLSRFTRANASARVVASPPASSHQPRISTSRAAWRVCTPSRAAVRASRIVR